MTPGNKEGLPVIADIDPSWLFLAGVVIITTILVRMAYRRSGTDRRGRKAAIPSNAAAPPLSSTYRDLIARLESKEVEINELSRESIARLDNKIAMLQRLLAEADAKIARLERVTVAAEGARREGGESGRSEMSR